MFRDLRADEIECRVAQAKETGVSLLLYKDARCDQNILDETVTPMNWMRHHCRDNANCVVSIWDDKKQMWIDKEDTGTESNTEKEKGLASDSFKRACFNWGIGRELYTAPFIWVKAADCTALKPRQDGKTWQCFDSFAVDNIEIENKQIVSLAIKNLKSGAICFVWSKKQTAPTPAPEKKEKDAYFRCEECEEILTPYMNNGIEIGVRRHANRSIKQYNKVLCLSCINHLKESEGSPDENGG